MILSKKEKFIEDFTKETLLKEYDSELFDGTFFNHTLQNPLVGVADITTKEYYSLKRLNLIITIYEHLSIMNDDPSIKSQYECLKAIANDYNIKLYEFDNELFSVRELVYVYNSKKTSPDIKIGRLYPSASSALLLNRQVRYFLFKDVYTDVRLVNSHPTILLDFAQQHDILCPTLQKYVLHRDEVVSDLILLSNNKEDKSSVKKKILIHLNTPIKYITKPDTFYSRLHLEISEIRNKIWEIHVAQPSMLRTYLMGSENFLKKTDTQKLLTAQSLYCFTQESDLLMSLYEFLKNKSKLHETELSFLPIFDGALVRYLDRSVQDKLKVFVIEYNSQSKLYKFNIEEFKPNWSPNFNEGIIEKYEKIETILKNMTISQFRLLLECINYPEFTLSDSVNQILTPFHSEIDPKSDANFNDELLNNLENKKKRKKIAELDKKKAEYELLENEEFNEALKNQVLEYNVKLYAKIFSLYTNIEAMDNISNDIIKQKENKERKITSTDNSNPDNSNPDEFTKDFLSELDDEITSNRKYFKK
jgi:hypothetical protein